MHVALVNTNRIEPPIAPIGLDYVAEALHAAGHHVEILDLCWVDDGDAAIAGFFSAYLVIKDVKRLLGGGFVPLETMETYARVSRWSLMVNEVGRNGYDQIALK